MDLTSPIPFESENCRKIIQFYLLESPVRTFKREEKETPGATADQPHPDYNFTFIRASRRGRTFQERGLDGSRLNTLRAAMKRVAPGIIMESGSTIPETYPESGEYIFAKRNENNVSMTEGYYNLIRNALAHGSVEVSGSGEETVYCLENYNPKSGKLNGVARLKETTLLAWMELADMKPDELKQAGRQRSGR